MAEIILPRAIEKEDLPILKNWRNSDIVMPYCRQYRPLSDSDMSKWYESLTQDKDYNLTNDLFIFERHYDTGKPTPLGVAGLVRIDWRNRKGELSFYLADTKGNTQETINNIILQVLGYAFKTLGLFKIYFPVYSFNSYLPLYEKVMKREYIARKEYFWDGVFHDRVILVKFANDFLKCEC